MDDLEQIRQLKYRFLRTLDTEQWDAFEDCFVPEATTDYAGLAFPDRAALVDYPRTHLGPVGADGCGVEGRAHRLRVDVRGDVLLDDTPGFRLNT